MGKDRTPKTANFERGTAESELLGQPAFSSSITCSEVKAFRASVRGLQGPGVSHVVSSCCRILLCSASLLVDVSVSGAGWWKFRSYSHAYPGWEPEFNQSRCAVHAGKPFL